jgi:hypothetical protein
MLRKFTLIGRCCLALETWDGVEANPPTYVRPGLERAKLGHFVN